MNEPRQANEPSRSKQWQDDLRAYDLVDLGATVAALQLVPDNAAHTLLLEALNAVVAREPVVAQRPRMNHTDLRSWLHASEWVHGTTFADAESGNLFTDQVTIPEGSFVVLPGPEEGVVFTIRHLLMAIRSKTDNKTIAHFCNLSRDLAISVLALSHEVASRAGLGRYVQAGPSAHQSVSLPEEAVLESLKAAVVFQGAELKELLGRYQLPDSSLDRITVQPNAPWDGQMWSNPLAQRPLVWRDGVLTVAAPTALLSALRHSLLALASEQGLLDPLTHVFRRAVYKTLESSFELWHLECLQAPYFDPDLPVCQGFFSLDRDKIVHLVLLSDDLKGWSLESPTSTWSLGELIDSCQAYFRDVIAHVAADVSWVREILHVVAVQGLGRPFAAGSSFEAESGTLKLVTAAEQIEIASLLEYSDPLALWKYARALAAIPAGTRLVALDPLAEYELYIAHDHSFYLSDGPLPNVLVLADDLSAHLRARLVRRLNRHGVLLPSLGRYVEVACVNINSDHPLFLEFPARTGRLRMVIELGALSIWILGPPGSLDGDYAGLYLNFAQGIAYWLWRIESSVTTNLAQIAEKAPIVEVELEIVPSSEWFDGARSSVAGQGIHCAVEEPGKALIRIDARACTTFMSEMNDGDRALVAQLVRLLSAWDVAFGQNAPKKIDESVVEAIVSEHVPLGHKRMITVLRVSSNSSLTGVGLPPYRSLQSADQEAALDELGAFLRERVSWTPNATVPPDSDIVQRLVVPFFLQELMAAIGGLAPTNLLEQLVSHHEAVLHTQRQHELSTPTRLACYGEDSGLEARAQQEMDEHRQAAIASRFLIELVAQRPPQGAAVLSLTTYDRMLALSSAIFTWGTTSDFVHYKLADLPLKMLSSGRLGVSREGLEAAQSAFGADHWREVLARRRSRFGDYWKPREKADAVDKPAEVEELDKATEAEFGASLTALVQFLSVLAQLGDESVGMVKCWKIGDLKERVLRELGWELRQLSLALDFFGLRPRRDFMAVDAPFKKEDLYPWRFNRPLSYLRRPLLFRGEGDDSEVVWGMGQLEDSVKYLVNLCIDGRLKAGSRAMRALISKSQQVASHAFNNKVASVFEGHGMSVFECVKKIGSVRIARAGRDLGDVDVLALAKNASTIFAVEVKNLNVGKTPAEIEHELRDTFAPDGPSAASRHLERIAWLREHRAEVLKHFGFDERWWSSWDVEGFIVVDSALFSPYLTSCPLQVFPLRRLEEYLVNVLASADKGRTAPT